MCDFPFKKFCPFYRKEISTVEYNYKLYQENVHLRQVLAENGIDYGWPKKDDNTKDKSE
jgi:regulator of replication initiation timing